MANKQTRRSRRKIFVSVMAIFLCVLMVGGSIMAIIPIGDDHSGHDHDTNFDSNTNITLDDILNSIETGTGTTTETEKPTDTSEGH